MSLLFCPRIGNARSPFSVQKKQNCFFLQVNTCGLSIHECIISDSNNICFANQPLLDWIALAQAISPISTYFSVEIIMSVVCLDISVVCRPSDSSALLKPSSGFSWYLAGNLLVPMIHCVTWSLWPKVCMRDFGVKPFSQNMQLQIAAVVS